MATKNKVDDSPKPPRPLSALIVEDKSRDVKLVAALLAQSGYTLTYHSVDTPGALQMELETGAYDVVISDYSLPGWTAMDALEIVKKSGKDLPVIVVTGSLGDEAAAECIKHGASDYVLKDRMARLPSAVEQALNERELREKRKRAEEEQRLSEDRYRDLVEHSRDLICTHDLTGKLLSVNPEPSRILGYTSAELLKKNMRDILAPEFQDQFDEYLTNIRRDGAAHGLMIVQTRSGEKRIWEYNNTLRTEGVHEPIVRGMASDVTDRMRAEKALRESQRRLEQTAHASNTGLWDWDLVTNAVYFSPEWKSQIGYTEDEIPNRFEEWEKRVHPDDREGALERVREYIAYPKAEFESEFRFQHKDGSYRWILARASILKDAPGTPSRMMGSHIDITDRKRAEQDIANLNRIYAVISQINEMIVRTRDTGHVLSEACRIAVEHGKFRMAWIGMVDQEVGKFKPLAWNGFVDGYLTVINKITAEDMPDGRGPTGTAVREAKTVCANDIATDTRMAPWRNEALQRDYRSSIALPILLHGKATGAFTLYSSEPFFFNQVEIRLLEEVSGDISFALEVIEHEKKRNLAEAALVKLKKAVDTSGEVIFMTDSQGLITFINPEFTRLYGYTAEEVVGKTTPRVLKSGEMMLEDYLVFWKTILDKQVAKREFTNRTKDGRLVNVEYSVNPILDERGEISGFLAIHRDVTERKKLEQQFRQAQKMEAVGQLAGGVAHDFNNILTVINGYSEVILDQLKPDNPHQKYVNEIKKAGERAASLTRQLLAFSRQQVLTPQVLNLNQVIANVHTMLERLIGENIDLATAPGPSLGLVKADPGQIEQVLLNLAVNARDAMPGGGKLSIETANVQLDDATVHGDFTVTPGNYVLLAVSDSGTGMDTETQKRIFEPFFTTKEKGKGTGLGLSTVYGIVKQSEGYISVYSEVGQGTTFKIYLPRVDAPVEVASPPTIETHLFCGEETILVVEDDTPIRELISDTLNSKGYKVLKASNAEEALQAAEKHQEPIRLLLTDLVMPGMSGRMLAERIAPLFPEMRVLYMSGYTDDAVIRHGALGAGSSFLQKPFTPEALSRKVREMLDAGAK